jgi:hypothetical protein
MEELIKLSKEIGFVPLRAYLSIEDGRNEIDDHLWMCELQKWLRDNRRIDVSPICTYKQIRFYHLGIIFITKDNKIDTIIIKDEGMPTNKLFNTYDEALKQGLIKSCELIIRKLIKQ